MFNDDGMLDKSKIREQPRWAIWHSFLIIAIVLSISSLLTSFFAGTKNVIDFALLLYLIQFAFYGLLPCYIACVHYGHKPASLGLVFNKEKVHLIFHFGAIWGISLYVINVLISLLQGLIFSGYNYDMQSILQLMQSSQNGWETAGLVICVVLLAPICEEIFFRGFLFSAIKAKFGRWIGIIASAAIFSLMHFDLWVILPLFAGGIGFAYIYDKYGNIFINIFAHMVWNSIAISLFFRVLK